jgi:hypothetical protein
MQAMAQSIGRDNRGTTTTKNNIVIEDKDG